VHVHIGVLLIGGAALRCLVGYLIAGEHVPPNGTFDYPAGGVLGTGHAIGGAEIKSDPDKDKVVTHATAGAKEQSGGKPGEVESSK